MIVKTHGALTQKRCPKILLNQLRIAKEKKKEDQCDQKVGFIPLCGIFRKKVGQDFGGWDFFYLEKDIFKKIKSFLKNFYKPKLKFSATLVMKNAIKTVRGVDF